MLNWFLRGLWDDALTLTPEEKKQVKFGVLKRNRKDKNPWLILLFSSPFLIAIAYFNLLAQLWDFSLTYFSTTGHYLALLTASVLYLLFFGWLWRRTYARHARRALRDLGYDICPHCGYWLRELPPITEKPYCPECGRVREKLPDPRNRDQP